MAIFALNLTPQQQGNDNKDEQWMNTSNNLCLKCSLLKTEKKIIGIIDNYGWNSVIDELNAIKVPK